MSLSWKEAFFRQASEDYKAFSDFNKKNALLCHQLHFFQMATEKLAKSFLAYNHSMPPKKSHYIFVRFLQTCKGRPEIRKRLLFSDARSFAQFIDSLLPLAQKIEELAPSADMERPNPEYPWIDYKTGQILSPISFNFPEYSLHNPKMEKLNKLVKDLFYISL
jgi:hypothetical protein